MSPSGCEESARVMILFRELLLCEERTSEDETKGCFLCMHDAAVIILDSFSCTLCPIRIAHVNR